MGFSKNKWFYIKYEGNWFSGRDFDMNDNQTHIIYQ